MFSQKQAESVGGLAEGRETSWQVNLDEKNESELAPPL